MNHDPEPPPPPPLPSPAAPLPSQIQQQWKVPLWPPRVYLRGHLYATAAGFYAVAASMFLQPDRYAADRWRGLMFLTAWATPRQWAAIFAVLATLKLAAALAYPHIAKQAMVGGIVVLTWWTVGFTFAFLDSDATLVPPVVTALLLGEHFMALTMIDGRRRWDS